ncbi:MAG: DUF502 domain-containing protein [Candidatus Sumerlaeia bacterium]
MNHFFHRAQRQVLAGLILIVPVAVTVLITIFAYNLINRFVGPLVDRMLYLWPLSAIADQRTLIGTALKVLLSLLTTLTVLYLAGAITTTLFTHKLYTAGEQLVLRIPFVKTVYGTTKQLLHLITAGGGGRFKRMALVEFPRPGIFSVGFVTGETRLAGDPRRFVSIFVPKAPNPTNGFLIILPEEDVRILDIGVDDGIKMVMSGGVIIPPQVNPEPFSSSTDLGPNP